MRFASVLLLAAVAACRHVPPDKEARAVVKPPEVTRSPAAAELLGAWRSVTLRGVLADLGHTAVYVFDEGGRYTGALVSEHEATPIGGVYAYAGGELALDDGAVVFTAAFVNDRLTLSSADAFVELVPLRRAVDPAVTPP